MSIEGSVLSQKLRTYFEGICVKKDSSLEQFNSLNIPSFIRDWFIRKYADNDGQLNVPFVAQEIRRVLPRRNHWPSLLDKVMQGEKVSFIGKIEVKQDIRTGLVTFELPDLGVKFNQTRIDNHVWSKCKQFFFKSNGAIWGLLSITYRTIQEKSQMIGVIILEDFKPFTPYNIDLNYYKKARKFFELDEWIDVLLGAIDYNANGFANEEEKLYMLKRLLPFCEKRLNLIELAPKGTGKSYLFSRISKFGWLASGGIMTRAKMFYDMNLKQDGLVNNYDYVALDEISTMRFGDISEMQGVLKGYLENGIYNVGNTEGKGEAGVVLLGNIDKNSMDINTNMFATLPEIFKDSALLDRFHGFVEGWKIPRMSENKKVADWALNTEYFANILHDLREDPIARSIVDKLVQVEQNADTRDVTAVKRLATALVKLLFPHWESLADVNVAEFEQYCLVPAVRMREIVNKQLALLDKEFLDKKMTAFTIDYNYGDNQ